MVQKGLRSCKHHKDLRTKMAHRFARVLGEPNWFWSAKHPKFVERWEHGHRCGDQFQYNARQINVVSLEWISWYHSNGFLHIKILVVDFSPPPNSRRWALPGRWWSPTSPLNLRRTRFTCEPEKTQKCVPGHIMLSPSKKKELFNTRHYIMRGYFSITIKRGIQISSKYM